jgi:hypothetical protein
MEDYRKFEISMLILFHVVLCSILASFGYSTFFLLKDIHFSNNYLILLGISSAIIAYYDCLFHRKLNEARERTKVKEETIKSEREKIGSFLSEKFDFISSQRLEKLIELFENSRFTKENEKGYRERISNHLRSARKALEEIKHKEAVKELTSKKEELEQQIRNLEFIKKKEASNNEERKSEIVEELDLDNNKVFLMEDLTDEKFEVLKEDGYVQLNEYDIISGSLVTALVKPTLNHTATHTFLVWSVIRFLQDNIEFAEDIEEHETRDADITFKYAGKVYALEIETGNLLKKQKQLREKVNYLNKKYKNKWMFVVSNKNLVSKYREFGLATQRKEVEKNLLKMLNISTR